jgi:hypothetical protein
MPPAGSIAFAIPPNPAYPTKSALRAPCIYPSPLGLGEPEPEKSGLAREKTEGPEGSIFLFSVTRGLCAATKPRDAAF